MDLKEIMGSDYKENMTTDEVKAYFEKGILESGKYENKDKSLAEKKELQKKADELNQQLQSKMSEDEKKKAQSEETQKQIEELQKKLADSQISISKSAAISELSESKVRLGIKDNDTDYNNFISDISFEDKEKTTKISKYINSLVKNAYELGKSETTKNKLGEMGNFNNSNNQNPSDDANNGSYGKKLAESNKVNNKNTKNFFERK